jgi:integrase
MSRIVPKYRKRSDGLAFVEHSSIQTKSHRMVIGRYGTESSLQRYRAFLAQLQGERSTVIIAGRFALVREIRDAYLDHAEHHYMRSYGLSSEYEAMTYALAALDPFLDMPSAQFGPRCLVAIRTKLASEGYVRATVNHTLSRIKKVFRWACENELCPTDLYHRLTCVKGLVEGQGGCKESVKVQPAALESINGVLPYVGATVGAMMTVQYKAGMRPGEVCQMQREYIDTSGDTWLYKPPHHKNHHRGVILVKALTPSLHSILLPYMGNSPFMFQPGRKRDRYHTETYRRAVTYGFRKAASRGVALESFTPNQLRHSIATHVAQQLGDRAAQVWCGHEQPNTTAIYVQTQTAELISIADKLEREWATSA